LWFALWGEIVGVARFTVTSEWASHTNQPRLAPSLKKVTFAPSPQTLQHGMCSRVTVFTYKHSPCLLPKMVMYQYRIAQRTGANFRSNANVLVMQPFSTPTLFLTIPK
jgi:hypothetical protein